MEKFLLIDNGSVLTESLTRLLPTRPTIVRFGDIQSTSAVGYDCVILSGSSVLPITGNESAFESEASLIRNSDVPIIGICLGAELIGHAFGATLRNLGEKRKGLIDITSTDKEGLLLEPGRRFSVYEAHRWTLGTVPENFRVLAESDHGPEIIKHVSRPVWGLQFHPEHLTDETFGDEIFSRIINRSLL
jgi:GMP synthase-like glutamine amidotransferase